MQLCRKITNNNPSDKAFYVFLILPYFINTENSFRNEKQMKSMTQQAILISIALLAVGINPVQAQQKAKGYTPSGVA